jgi:hypothetical protein
MVTSTLHYFTLQLYTPVQGKVTILGCKLPKVWSLLYNYYLFVAQLVTIRSSDDIYIIDYVMLFRNVVSYYASSSCILFVRLYDFIIFSQRLKLFFSLYTYIYIHTESVIQYSVQYNEDVRVWLLYIFYKLTPTIHYSCNSGTGTTPPHSDSTTHTHYF